MADYENSDMELCFSEGGYDSDGRDGDEVEHKDSRKTYERDSRRYRSSVDEERAAEQPRKLRSVVRRVDEKSRHGYDEEEVRSENRTERDDRTRKSKYRDSRKHRTGNQREENIPRDRRRSYELERLATREDNDESDEEHNDSSDDTDGSARGAVGGKRRRQKCKDVDGGRRMLQRDMGRMEDDRLEEKKKHYSPIERGDRRQNMKPRTFDGNSPWESFLIQFEICARYNKWSDSQKVAQLQCCLVGKASQVLWDTDMSEVTSYKQLSNKLKARFSSSSQRERFVEELRCRRRRQGESLSDLHADIRRLFALAYAAKVMDTDISEAIARDYFINSLDDPDLEIRVKERDPVSLDDALKAAIRAETHLKSYRCASDRSMSETRDRQKRDNYRTRHVKDGEETEGSSKSTGTAQFMNKIMEQMEIFKRQNEDLSKELGRLRLISEQAATRQVEQRRVGTQIEVGAQAHEKREERRCYSCGETGHISSRCPSKTPSRPKEGNRSCFNCGLPGHFGRECPEKRKGNEKERTEARVSNMIKAKVQDRMTYIEVEFGQSIRLSLLDTGSEITLLPIGLPGTEHIEPSTQKVIAANGSGISIIGVTTVAARINGVRVDIEGYVTPNVDEVIIGIDILEKWKCVWDFQTGQIQIFGMVIQLKSRPLNNICRRIVLTEDVTVPPRTEMIVSGTVVFPAHVRTCDDSTWASECNQAQPGIYVASVVIPNRVVDIPMRLANVTKGYVTLPARASLGALVPVEVYEGVTQRPFSANHNTVRSTTMEEINRIEDGSEYNGELDGMTRVSTIRQPHDTGVDGDGAEVSRGEDKMCTGNVNVNELVDMNGVRPEIVKEESDVRRDAIIEEMISTADSSVGAVQKDALREILRRYEHAFSFSEWDLGCTQLITHEIDTGTAKPCRQRLRRQPPSHDAIIKEQIDTLLQQEVIEPAQSPWASNVVIVQKKDGKFRMCIDYRSVNDVTRKDSYCTARVDTALDALSGSAWFSTLDLRSSYHQILVEESDRDKTAWICKFGQFRYRRMPFGLCNSGATFQRLIDLVLSGIAYVSCLAYIDDIIIFSRSIPEHLERLSIVLQRISDAKLKCRPDKCVFLRTSVEFLGHLVSNEGVAILPSRIETVSSWPRPRSVKEVREVVGLMSYYRRHIKGFADTARPMTDLLKGRTQKKFQWNDEAEAAFQQLKNALVTSPVLAMPVENGTYVLDTDASSYAIGAVLSQRQNGTERVIAYGSRRLKGAESNYCTTRRELLSIVHFVKYFRCYLIGTDFLVRTDHAALVWLRRIAEPVGQQARWLEELENYTFKVEHRAGSRHGNADAMSRRPVCDRHVGMRKCPVCDAEHVIDRPDEALANISRTEETDGENTMDRPMPSLREEEDESIRYEGDAAIPIQENEIHDSNKRTIEGRREGECCHIEISSEERIKELQLADSDIGWICRLLIDGSPKPVWAEVSNKSAGSKALWSQWERLKMDNGVLVRRYENLGDDGDIFQIIIPKTLRREYIRQIHAGFAGAHLGRTRTEHAIRRRFYWPGWLEDVDLELKSCISCVQYSRGKPQRQVGLLPIECGEPFEIVSVDITGPHPVSYSGHTYILTIQDHFSRWTEAYPLRRRTATAVARQLFDNWFSRFGFPRCLLSDLGAEFEGTVMTEICRLAKVDKLRTTAYSPKTNGKLERFHKTLNSMLAKCVSGNQKDWSDYLAFVTAAYRATRHEATGFSPNRIILGRETRAPVDLIYSGPSEQGPVSVSEYVNNATDRLKSSYELVRQHAGKAAELMRVRYDRKVKLGDELKCGQKVLYYYPRRYARRSPKWQSVFVGPFTVVRQIDAHRVVIQKTPKHVPIVVGRDKIKIIREGTVLHNTDNNGRGETRVQLSISADVEHTDRSLTNNPYEGEVDGGRLSDEGCDPVNTRMKRACHRPKYLNDYCVRCITCSISERPTSDEMAQSKEIMEAVTSVKRIECQCGARFTTKRSWNRHRRGSCSAKEADMAIVDTDGTVVASTSVGITAREVVSGVSTPPQMVGTPKFDRQKWIHWFQQRPEIDVDSMADQLKDDVMIIPKPYRQIVLELMTTAVSAAVEVYDKPASGTGTMSQLVSEDSVAGQEDQSPVMRTRRVMIVDDARDVTEGRADGQLTSVAAAPIANSGPEVQLIESSVMEIAAEVECADERVPNIDPGEHSCGDPHVASDTPGVTDVDEGGTNSLPESGKSSDAPEENVNHDGVMLIPAPGPLINIEEEVILCSTMFLARDFIDLEHCERVLSASARFGGNVSTRDMARLVYVAFLTGLTRMNEIGAGGLQGQ